MAEKDCIVEIPESEVSPENFHRYTVGYVSHYSSNKLIPALSLKGQWLAAAGFDTGTKVNVRVMNGCIVITAKRPEPELMTSLKRVCKFSASKQRQVQALIDAVANGGRA
ncbi:endoribonuclease SymE [Leminorella grimontii]|uniref:Endoribonuclease SymE n=1 Tax=Leminorella grimontii TaxID=82981 RepID=A0AAV5MZN1_9GAMM|nr:endoribonuclease SymE [Leminorella grimontii]KFC97331.1 SymE family toxin [Leminorella grimontii ATCC 33999 = DSM 5078]GKX55316.1 endoribonuclease SymE [Leminorella grimontii]VFS56597.1 Putative endoribonuclease symE [Leminorella grimontii]